MSLVPAVNSSWGTSYKLLKSHLWIVFPWFPEVLTFSGWDRNSPLIGWEQLSITKKPSIDSSVVLDSLLDLQEQFFARHRSNSCGNERLSAAIKIFHTAAVINHWHLGNKGRADMEVPSVPGDSSVLTIDSYFLSYPWTSRSITWVSPQQLYVFSLLLTLLLPELVFWNSIHLEVASDSFCFLINSSWLLVFILGLGSFICFIFFLCALRLSLLFSHRITFLSSSCRSFSLLSSLLVLQFF